MLAKTLSMAWGMLCFCTCHYISHMVKHPSLSIGHELIQTGVCIVVFSFYSFKVKLYRRGYILTSSHIHYCWLDLHILFVLLPFSDLLRLVLPSNSPTLSIAPSGVLFKPVLGTPPPYFVCFPHRTYPIQVLKSLLKSW